MFETEEMESLPKLALVEDPHIRERRQTINRVGSSTPPGIFNTGEDEEGSGSDQPEGSGTEPPTGMFKVKCQRSSLHLHCRLREAIMVPCLGTMTGIQTYTLMI